MTSMVPSHVFLASKGWAHLPLFGYIGSNDLLAKFSSSKRPPILPWMGGQGAAMGDLIESSMYLTRIYMELSSKLLRVDGDVVVSVHGDSRGVSHR
ncbi:hypothetical protein Tco_0349314 [Tanacetum coccineum]